MLSNRQNLITSMIIPAAGYGTRMQKITDGSSKEILQVDGKPALIHAIMEAVNARIFRIGIVIRKGKEDIVEVIHNDLWLASVMNALEINFFYQPKPNGEIGAILVAEKWLGKDPFVVHYPDNIIAKPKGALATLVSRQATLQKDMVLLTKRLPHAQAAPCGLEILDNRLYRLKPEDLKSDSSFGLRPTGIYVATRYFLESCRELDYASGAGEIKDQQVRCHMMNSGHLTLGLDLRTLVIDVGNPDGYKYAKKEYPL